MLEQVKRIISKYNVDTTEVRGIIQGIILADMLFGGNRREMSFTKLRGSDDFNGVLKEFGVSNGSETLPEVQQYRLIVDALIIATKSFDYDLCSEASYKVANIKNNSKFHHGSYNGIDYCRKVLAELSRGSDSDYPDIAYIVDRVKSANADEYAKEAWKDITFPYEDSVFTKVKPDTLDSKVRNVSEYKDYMIDTLIYYLIHRFFQSLKECERKHKYAVVNGYLRKIRDAGINIGYISYGNYLPKLNIYSAIDRRYTERVKWIFSDNMNCSLDDLETLVIMISYVDHDRPRFTYKEYVDIYNGGYEIPYGQ